MHGKRSIFRALSALGIASLIAGCSGSTGAVTPSAAAPASQTLTHNGILPEAGYNRITVKGHPEMIARFAYVADPRGYGRAHPDGSCSFPTFGVPTWSNSFTDNGTTYCYQMIGVKPTKSAKAPTLKTQVYAVKLTFSNGDVYDPLTINKKCDSVSPYTRYLDSPLYNASPIVNGKVKVGTLQYEAAQSAGEWYKFVKGSKSYGLTLANAGKPILISLTVPASDGTTQSIAGFCAGSIGEVDANWLSEQISTAKWSVSQDSIILLNNVFQTSGGCCILGYHGDWQNSKGDNGVYGFISLNNAGVFSATGIQDIHAASHELGETINDPTGNNIVPAWGHIGQQPNCQNNLEVGDPLTGTVYGGGNGIVLKGFTYHPEELVYFNWFTQQTKYGPYGADSVYSMSGTFSSPAALCT